MLSWEPHEPNPTTVQVFRCSLILFSPPSISFSPFHKYLALFSRPVNLCEACFSHYCVALVGLVLLLPVSWSSLSLSLFCCIGSVFAKHNISTVERLLGACVLSLSNTLPHACQRNSSPPFVNSSPVLEAYWQCVYCWMGHCIATLAPCVWLRFTSDTLGVQHQEGKRFSESFLFWKRLQ